MSDLREGLREYLKAAMTFLAQRYPRRMDLPLREVRGYHRPAPGHLEPQTRTVIHWRAVVRHSAEELEGLQQTRELLEQVALEAQRGLPIDRLVGADLFGIKRIDAGTFLRAVLELALLAGDTIEGNSDGTANAIEHALRYLQNSTVEFQVLAPLHGFHCDTDRIDLEEAFSVIRLSDEDWEWLDPANFFVDALALGQEEFALMRRIQLPKRVDKLSTARSLSEHDRLIQEDFSRAISCLRMFKPGAVGFSYYRWGPAEWNPTSASVGRSSSHPSRLRGSPYRLTADESDALKVFVRNEWTKMRQGGRLAVALRWFNSSYERLKVEERLVDYAIALEALVGDSSSGLTYRLALRTAVLVGESFVERAEIAALVRELYKARSEVVHGVAIASVIKRLQRNHDLGTFVSRCECLVRDAIRAHCRECVEGQEVRFLKALDERMLGSDM